MILAERFYIIEHKKSPRYSFLYLRRINKSAVPLKLAFAHLLRIQTYTPPDNGCGLRQLLLSVHEKASILTVNSIWKSRPASGFKAALESPFSKSVHTAIPPPAALCENTIENVLLFLNGFSCLVMGIIVRKGLFVKKNNKKSLETCKLCRTERKMVISKKNITFQKLP